MWDNNQWHLFDDQSGLEKIDTVLESTLQTFEFRNNTYILSQNFIYKHNNDNKLEKYNMSDVANNSYTIPLMESYNSQNEVIKHWSNFLLDTTIKDYYPRNFHKIFMIGDEWWIATTRMILVYNTNPNSIKEDIKDEQYLYPNPASDYISVPEQTNRYEILNLTGEMIISDKNSGRIDITHIESGIYIIKLIDSNNKIQIKKFIKL